MNKCRSIRDLTNGVIKRAEAREVEVDGVKVHAIFHDDAGDLEEWLEGKKIVVENVPTRVSETNPMENLRQIRSRKKKLEDIKSGLVANQKVKAIPQNLKSLKFDANLRAFLVFRLLMV